MKQLTILVLVDGNNKIGMGHVYKQINLGKILLKLNHNVVFLTKDLIAKKMLSKISKCEIISKTILKKHKEMILKIHPDIIVIDKLNENKNLIKILKKICPKILAIDYTGKHKELLPYGINILYPKSGLSGPGTFSGLQYAILDNRFTNKKNLAIRKQVKSILILQGGADTYCFIPKIIWSLGDLDKIRVTVVLGPSFQCWKKLKTALKHTKNQIKILKNVKNMSNLMIKHDVAISAGGMTLLELACLGIPSVIVCAEKFENETANLLTKKGFGINLGFGRKVSKIRIKKAVTNLVNDYRLRKTMNKHGRKIVDGKGTKKAAHIIQLIGTEFKSNR